MKNISVNGLWMSDENTLPVLAVMCINSYLRHHHSFTLWAYHKFTNLPGGCILGDASEILPWKSAYRDVSGTYAHFSDHWRWKFLLERGGFWTDMDVCCLSDDIPEINGIHICSMDGTVQEAMVGTLMLPKGHRISELMLEICREPWRINRFDHAELLELKKKVLRKYHTEKELMENAAYPSTYRCFGNVLTECGFRDVLPPEVIYPISYHDINRFTVPKYTLESETKENTACIHIWSSRFAKAMRLYIQIPCILHELYDMFS